MPSARLVADASARMPAGRPLGASVIRRPCPPSRPPRRVRPPSTSARPATPATSANSAATTAAPSAAASDRAGPAPPATSPSRSPISCRPRRREVPSLPHASPAGVGTFPWPPVGTSAWPLTPFIEVSPVIYIGNDSPRRSVSILGKWRLVLQFCAWSIRRNNQTIATWKSSNGLIDHALKVLSGQSILNVDVNSQNARTIFTFDLGCIVTTWPYDADGEQWSLFDPNGYVLMLRGDARCRYGPSDHIPSDEWTNIVSA